MFRHQISGLIEKLAGSTDLHRVLAEHGISARKAVQAMRSVNGRREIRALRELSRMHSRIVAHRYSPYAIHKLCQLLSDEKSDVRLKGALSLLSLAGMTGKRMKGGAGKGRKEEPVEVLEEEEAAELLMVVAEEMEKRRTVRQKAGGDSGGGKM